MCTHAAMCYCSCRPCTSRHLASARQQKRWADSFEPAHLWVSLSTSLRPHAGRRILYKLVVATAAAGAATVTTTFAATLASAAARAANCYRNLLADAVRDAAGYRVRHTPRHTLPDLDGPLVAHWLADRVANCARPLLRHHVADLVATRCVARAPCGKPCSKPYATRCSGTMWQTW